MQHSAVAQPMASKNDMPLAERILSQTSKSAQRPCMLVLADGAVFYGRACGARGEAVGEICFNTSLEGYLEVLTDPSYAGQIITMTYPQIGNYGVNLEDVQSGTPALRGMVVHDMCRTPSNWRSDMSLPEFLESRGIVAIEGIDTRALTRHIRDYGAQQAIISTEDLNIASLKAKVDAAPSIVGVNLARTVSCPVEHSFGTCDLPQSQAFAVADPAEGRFGRPRRGALPRCGLRLRRQALHPAGPRARGLRAHRGSVGHARREGPRQEPRRRFSLQRPGRPRRR